MSAPTKRDSTKQSHKGMVWVEGGEFWMGSEDFYPEERPVHRVAVDGFWMAEHPVTVAQFRRFVKATGYVTWAEQTPTPEDYPDAPPELLVPGIAGLHRHARSGRSVRLPQLVDLDPRRRLAPPGRTRLEPQRARPAPGNPRRLHGRSGLRGLGRTGPADRSRMGICGTGEAWTARPSAGATTSLPREGSWPTPGRGRSPGRICFTTATSGLHRSKPSRPTATASTTWQAMCGSGRRTSSRPAMPPRSGPAARRTTPGWSHRLRVTRQEYPPRPFPAASPKAAHTYAPPTTASDIGRRPDKARPSTPPPVTSGSVASYVRTRTTGKRSCSQIRPLLNLRDLPRRGGYRSVADFVGV